jgi:DNA-binding CsgD family transcriptional regulator
VVNISQYPYYSYDHLLDQLMAPIKNHADIQLLFFKRSFSNDTMTFVINTHHREFVLDYYAKNFHKFSFFHGEISLYKSRFYMWDHFNHQPSLHIYKYMRDVYNLAHGLNIIEKHANFCDLFVFATKPGDGYVNNIYINQRDLFINFVQNFYQNFEMILKDISRCKVMMPTQNKKMLRSKSIISPRQNDCGRLLAQGFTSKEIGKILKISPRTVEEYINILKRKSGAKNRAQLIFLLRESI